MKFHSVATLIITNFHLHLIQLWWQFFQNFVYGDVVYAQTWGAIDLEKLYRATLNQQGRQSVSHGSFIDFEFQMIKVTQVYSYLVPYISPVLASIRMLVGFHN